MECSRRPSQVGSDEEGGDESDPVLALSTDVEEPAAERKGDANCRQDKWRHQDQRLLMVVGSGFSSLTHDPGKEPVEARAFEERLVGAERVVPRDQDNEAADQEGQ